MHSRLTVLSGPSGVGKSTVVAELARTSPQIWISVSVTTRRPRPGEVDGTPRAPLKERRLAAAKEELAAADEFDITLVNTSVQDVCRQLVALMEQ